LNEILKTYKNHRSIRSYLDQPVDEQHIDWMIEGAQAAPSSINGQQISIVVIKNKETKEALADLCGGQPWIAQAPVFLLFVADYYRAKIAAQKNNEQLVITDSLESIMVSSVDVGLAMSNAIGVAESLGLGIVPIGAVRREPQAIIDLLNLPEYVFPIAGLVVGHAKDHSALKPRLPVAAVRHDETYNHDIKAHIDAYDITISNYMKERSGGKNDRNWTQTVSGFYNKVYFPNVSPTIKKQGFKNE
jgi:FMN reductase [NAD(P)H]